MRRFGAEKRSPDVSTEALRATSGVTAWAPGAVVAVGGARVAALGVIGLERWVRCGCHTSRPQEKRGCQAGAQAQVLWALG